MGIKMSDRGTLNEPRIQLDLFANRPLSADLVDALAEELVWRFDLDANLAGFIEACGDDPVLAPALERWRGMRVGSSYSLYEYLAVAIVLQNTTVRRSVQMMQALFDRFGSRVTFDDRDLCGFWQPEDLTSVSEEELRQLKVGYRAKSISRIAKFFAEGQIDALSLRDRGREETKDELLRLYGVGPASVWYILFEVFHHYDAFDVISPWEQKIYSRLLFDSELEAADVVLEEVRKRWGPWRMLAAHYVFEDLFWRRRNQSVPWLEKLIRL